MQVPPSTLRCSLTCACSCITPLHLPSHDKSKARDNAPYVYSFTNILPGLRLTTLCATRGTNDNSRIIRQRPSCNSFSPVLSPGASRATARSRREHDHAFWTNSPCCANLDHTERQWAHRCPQKEASPERLCAEKAAACRKEDHACPKVVFYGTPDRWSVSACYATPTSGGERCSRSNRNDGSLSTAG